MPAPKDPSLQEIDAIRSTGLRAQVVACLIHNNKLLFVYQNEYQLWQLPQGGIKNRETAPEALMREIAEELGDSITEAIQGKPIQLSPQQIAFPKEKYDVKKLVRDDGTQVTMKGKFYFVYALPTKHSAIRLDETQFDDFKWCSYQEAQELIETIYQKGKQRITRAITEELFSSGMIE